MGEVNIYQKVGNTAYVTFDSFTLARSGNYQQDLAQPLGDTIAIISAVHQAIIADEEIENVVLDLSCNGGGAVDAAIYTIAWMLGYCDFSIVNSITNSKSTITYKADVNYDHEFDEADSISNKNLYCLISPVSFSCGNLVPALLKASSNVTIVGKTSTGGGCVVRHGVTADGTTFNISNSKQFATVKNGTYYSVDHGVEPDIPLTKIESFYDRAGLAEYLNGLK
jgi:C-terminal processing protease CtpA/Prc